MFGFFARPRLVVECAGTSALQPGQLAFTRSPRRLPAPRRLELAEREATLQLQKAEAVTMAVRTARAELRRLAGLQRAAEAQAAAAAEAAARVEQVRAPGGVCGAGACCGDGYGWPSTAHAFAQTTYQTWVLRPLLPSDPISQDAAALRQQKATGWRPKVGQSVFVPRLGKRAKVVAVDATSGALTLQAGLIKIQATPDEVRQQ